MTVPAVPQSIDERNRQTVRTAAGVRTNPAHWANAPVHAFHQWLGRDDDDGLVRD